MNESGLLVVAEGLARLQRGCDAEILVLESRDLVQGSGQAMYFEIFRCSVAITDVDDKRHTLCYFWWVQTFAWSSKKNELLKEERGISFEQIVLNMQLGNEVDIFDHPNQERYPGQKISVVLVEGYAYLVPFVETEEEIFLKIIIPSRKATKQHKGDSDEQA